MGKLEVSLLSRRPPHPPAKLPSSNWAWELRADRVVALAQVGKPLAAGQGVYAQPPGCEKLSPSKYGTEEGGRLEFIEAFIPGGL